ncbi:hypothetical protein KSF_075310 [Reticulibacter mediterranei]|uniref:Aminoglycoside phosphotransferase domain-containing protein n=1 Tax=Reticulibacter mediterranei TaxID=2778369 RepID=A0A8J3IRW1_9CHLR|nr:phosphotransferase [Reticulibacter mediterranei]GHO97483.1 hypothetical protein KSF_075310 [Reticulibacter mediterranei]
MTTSSTSSQEKHADIFPVTYSVLSSDILQERVLSHYAFEAPITCRLLVHGFHDHYLVQTANGKYMLRVYQAPRSIGRTWRTSSDVLYEIDLLLHLHRKGVAVSVPVARKDGTLLQTLQAPEGPRQAVLFTYVEGVELSPASIDEMGSRLYGSTVAELHNAADDFTSTHARFSLDQVFLIEASLNATRPLLVEQRQKEWKYLVQTAQLVKERLEWFVQQGLETGACHGDAQGGNASLSGEKKLTFFDFDCCGYGWRAYELAVFYWAAALGKNRLGKSAEEVEQLWMAYLAGYQERRPLKEIDKQAIPLLVIARHFWFLGANTANWDYWGWNRADEAFFKRELDFLHEWVEHKIKPV